MPTQPKIDGTAALVAVGAALEVEEVSLPEAQVLAYLNGLKKHDRVLASTLAGKVFGEEDDWCKSWHLFQRMESKGLIHFAHKKLAQAKSHQRNDRREVKLMESKKGKAALERIGRIISLDSQEMLAV